MKARVQRWGNSLAIRIPQAFARETNIERDTEVELTVADGDLIVRPVRRSVPRLEELLARVSSENLHAETDMGDPVGQEAW